MSRGERASSLLSLAIPHRASLPTEASPYSLYTLPDVCGSSTLRRVWSRARASGTNCGAATDRTLKRRAGEGVVMRLGPFLLIAILLLLAWGGGFLMFHVASGIIHLLLVLAILSFLFHFLTGRRTV